MCVCVCVCVFMGAGREGGGIFDPIPLTSKGSLSYHTNTCVRADTCFALPPDSTAGDCKANGVVLKTTDNELGDACLRAAILAAAQRSEGRSQLRFGVGDRVACLVAGPDGGSWPRSWRALAGSPRRPIW